MCDVGVKSNRKSSTGSSGEVGIVLQFQNLAFENGMNEGFRRLIIAVPELLVQHGGRIYFRDSKIRHKVVAAMAIF